MAILSLIQAAHPPPNSSKYYAFVSVSIHMKRIDEDNGNLPFNLIIFVPFVKSKSFVKSKKRANGVP